MVQDARYRNWRLILVTTQLLDTAKRLRLQATPNRLGMSRAICLPTTTTRETANRVSPWPFGEP
jgi:hypothetical protein